MLLDFPFSFIHHGIQLKIFLGFSALLLMISLYSFSVFQTENPSIEFSSNFCFFQLYGAVGKLESSISGFFFFIIFVCLHSIPLAQFKLKIFYLLWDEDKFALLLFENLKFKGFFNYHVLAIISFDCSIVLFKLLYRRLYRILAKYCDILWYI